MDDSGYQNSTSEFDEENTESKNEGIQPTSSKCSDITSGQNFKYEEYDFQDEKYFSDENHGNVELETSELKQENVESEDYMIPSIIPSNIDSVEDSTEKFEQELLQYNCFDCEKTFTELSEAKKHYEFGKSNFALCHFITSVICMSR